MFTAIQTKFQKHYKVLFFIMLVVVIVAFVFTIGAAPGIGGDARAAEQEFFGYNLASERDQIRLIRAAELSYRMEHGELSQMQPGQLENRALERLAYLAVAEELAVPGPNDEELMNFIFTRTAFHDQSERFDRRRYSRFTDEIEADPQRSDGDVVLVLEEDYRIEKVRDLIGGPGYVHTTEIRRELEYNKTLWTLSLASYDLSGFEPEIDPNEENLKEFFESNPRRYERQPQTVFSYVEFRPDDFLDKVPELDEEDIETYFEDNRERFAAEPPPAEDGDEEEESETSLDDVRDEVVEALRQERANRLANHAASDFTYTLFDEEIRPDSERFPEIVEEYNGTIHDAPPASPNNFPQELGFPWQVQQEVFRLTDRRFFSDPQRLDDRFVVFIYRDTLDAEIPPFEEVKDRVVQDYEAQEERRLLSEAGSEIRQRLQSRLDEGESFSEAAEAEGLEPREIGPFSRIGPPQDLPQPVLQRIDEFKKDRVSSMIQAQNYGFFAILKERDLPDIDTNSGEFMRTAQSRREELGETTPIGVVQEFVEQRLTGTANR